MDAWKIDYSDWRPDDQPLRESLCALGNGYFVTRAADETRRAGGVHYPGTYLAGGYDRATTRIAGHDVENEDLVNWPNWLYLTFRPAGGEWVGADETEVLEHEQILDMRRAELTRTLLLRDAHGRVTTLRSRRVVSMADRHLGAIEWQLTPENWSGRLELRSEIDGRVRNEGVERYRNLEGNHVEVCRTERADEETTSLAARTLQSKIRMGLAARLRVESPDGVAERRYVEQGDRVGEEVAVDLREGATLRVEKIVAIVTTRDWAISEPLLEACKITARAPSMEAILADHRRAWDRLWKRFDLAIADQQHLRLLRLHTFHLLQTVSLHTIEHDAGIPARGWHGEAYRGHVLWDELFVFSLLDVRLPDLTRALLMYRYRRLREARAAAREEGRRGAKYPWQSGSDGREESQSLHLNPRSGRWIPDNSHLQRHINLAVAYNVWQYYETTGDTEFMASYGAEIMLEIARYMAERAEHDESDRRWHIRGVMGPDEFHEGYPDADAAGVDDNAYTNVMTACLLARVPRLLGLLDDDRREELRADLDLGDAELERWDRISRGLHVPFHDDGIISQFAGYEKLEELDWEHYREKYHDTGRLDRILESEGDSVSRYKVAKQADVLMLFFLLSADELHEMLGRLGYHFDPEQIPRNIEYYLDRTSHGSTLSRVVHAWVLARSDRERSWRLFVESLRSDIEDVQNGTTPEGIHLGAMAGTVDLVHRCYTGLEVREDLLRLDPCLPESLRSLRFAIRYRGRGLAVHVDGDLLTMTAAADWTAPMTVHVRERRFELAASDSVTIDLRRLRAEDAPPPEPTET